MSVTVETFVALYAKRDENVPYYALEDVALPYSAESEMIVFVSGHSDKGSEACEVKVALYDGLNEDLKTDRLKYLVGKTLHVNPDEDGDFHLLVPTGIRPVPSDKNGVIRPYTVALFADDEQLRTAILGIGRFPANPHKAVTPLSLSAYRKDDEDESRLYVDISFRSLLSYGFQNTVSIFYLESRHEPESPLDISDNLVFVQENFIEDFTPGRPVQIDAAILVDHTWDTNVFCWCVVAVGGVPILKVPVDDEEKAFSIDSFLVPYSAAWPKTGIAPTNDMLMPEQLAASSAPVSVNLLDYAPENFKHYLQYLRDVVTYNEGRKQQELSTISGILRGRHYIITGNEGVGKEEAARAIYAELKNLGVVRSFTKQDGIKLFDSTDGFANNIDQLINNNRNTLIYIQNADSFGRKGAIGSTTGVEAICNNQEELNNCVIVLSGSRNQLLEAVNSSPKAQAVFTNVFHFEDLHEDSLYKYALQCFRNRECLLTSEACDSLYEYMKYVYSMRGNRFTNTKYVEKIIESQILPHMISRVVSKNERVSEQMVIEASDIPEVEIPDPTNAIAKLNALVGLDDVKKRILDHTSLVRLNKLRADRGLYNKMPPMHMVFTGNPGTGKTTIAKYLGEIYHGIGVLSKGHVVETERSKLIGRYFGDAEQNTLDALQRASGGILFIDEAYSLFVKADDTKDYGMRVIETLLTFLAQDEPDLMVILAGYTKEMNEMLEANPGLKSRFSYVFEFEDYSPNQLMEIGHKVLEREHYVLTPEAEKKLSDYVIDAYNHKDDHFGNGRFITRLLISQVIPALGNRLSALPADKINNDQLTRIEACDIPDLKLHYLKPDAIDELLLNASLEQLDKLVGMQTAKKALHDYVTVSRLQHQNGTLRLKPVNLCWEFIGRTGTGKSTVAEILAKILQGLGILKLGHMVCVNAEELMGNDGYKVLEQALKKASDGLLFLDMDAPEYKHENYDNLRMWIMNKITERKQVTAFVMARITNSDVSIAKTLAAGGIASYHNSIVFDDFTAEELSDVLAFLLRRDFKLEISADAKKKLDAFIRNMKNGESKDMPISARTMQHLSQTIATIAQLRIASDGTSASEVIAEDVDHFEWSRQTTGKIGF